MGMVVGKNIHPYEESTDSNSSDGLNNRKIFGYYIMPKYPLTLQDYINKNKGVLRVRDILRIMIQILDSLRILHQVGYTHNDIKPNNIMIDKDLNVTLIDLGFTTKFMESADRHIK
jgi:vaccinia related kinase